MVICVFLFHTNIHLKADYGIFNSFIRMGACCMTGFFLLSGYVLSINYNNIEINADSLSNYYKKRFISLIPMYWIVSFAYIIIYKQVKDNLILLPIEILGLQSFFSSIFDISHNGGTWFISCLILCYFLFPFIQYIVRSLNRKNRLLVLGLLSFILLYSSVVVWYFNLNSIYSNPFFRLVEFCIGMILFSFKEDIEKNKFCKILLNKITILFELLLLITGISIAVKFKIVVSNNLYNYMLYNFISLPLFILMIISCSGVKFEGYRLNKVLEFLSGVSYMFFLSQLFIFDLTKNILVVIKKDTNLLRICISLFLCLLLSFVLHKFEVIIISKSKKVLKI